MENPPEGACTVFVISIWVTRLPDGQSAWRGVVRRSDGRRRSFSTLASLSQLISEATDWQDCPPDPLAQGQEEERTTR